jgi:hypothetical protein
MSRIETLIFIAARAVMVAVSPVLLAWSFTASGASWDYAKLSQPKPMQAGATPALQLLDLLW